ncbi:hypothetical protein BKA64DRAFT_730274 [Cadophora sp. MPI-SDFR-AT-0126]|nr:hypothetical protein BKA64DRAFT_730274 [Leotiomycetes sp. MPI-SDFR-AT-0126]
MLFNRENGRHIDTNDTKEVLAVKGLFYLILIVRQGLRTRHHGRGEPVFGVDELILLLIYYWARDTSTFSTERQRCRPAELVDAKTKKKKKNKKQRWPGLEDDDAGAGHVTDRGFEDAEISAGTDSSFDNDHDSAVADLGSGDDGDGSDDDVNMSDVGMELRKFNAFCYEDVRLLVVRNPIAGKPDVRAMEVKLAHYKGADRRPKPTIFFFTEVDNPMLCPITYLVTLAVADKAFEALSLTTVERVFEQKKQEILKTPIFRQDGGAVDGVLLYPTLAFTYSQFADRLKLLGLLMGLLAILTSRCFRRNTGNVVDHEATSAVRDQVMRHNPNSAVYNAAYINERVLFDVQSAVLERPSADGILRMLTHMSLMRDPRAPVHVPDDVLAAFPPDPRITDLEEKRAQLKAGAYRIQGTEVEAEVRRLTSEISIARTRRRNVISQEFRADYFRRRPIEDIERQNSGQQEEEYTEPVVEHQIPERAQLAEFICNHVTGLTPQEIVARRIHFAGLMLGLCRRREVPRRYRLRVALPQPPLVKEESPPPSLELFPIKLAKDQCPICIGDESKSYDERMGSFCRPAKMMDHVERIHLKGRDPHAKIEKEKIRKPR